MVYSFGKMEAQMIRQLFKGVKNLLKWDWERLSRPTPTVIEREGHAKPDRAITKFYKSNLLAAAMAIPVDRSRRRGRSIRFGDRVFKLLRN